MTSPAELPPRGRRGRSPEDVTTELTEGWSVAPGEPGADTPPTAGWLPAQVPGTVADALLAAGSEAVGLDERDWWWRLRLDTAAPAANEELVLHLDGVTPFADVLMDGRSVATVRSMFQPAAIGVPGPGELVVRCRARAPEHAQPRPPRRRWRTAGADNSLRFVRTTLFGRAPGFAPGPPIIGPWRSVRLERRRSLSIEGAVLVPSLEGDEGVLSVDVGIRGLGDVEVRDVEVVLSGPSEGFRAPLAGNGRWSGSLRVPDVDRWWPHTHGTPVLHDVTLEVATSAGLEQVALGAVGFRTLAAGPATSHDVERDGLDLHVNGVRVFARGAVWTRPGGPTSSLALRPVLERVRDCGMNMLRIPGTGVYETPEMHDLCDQLGILLWQDAMLANFDYPESDPEFVALLEAETSHVLAELAGRPSFAVFCGGSEIEQQAAMLGLDPDVARGGITRELLPRLVGDSGCDAVYVPSSPSGGDLPFRTNRGVAHYYGVGGYRRPFADVRLADVRFASECLALSNIPSDDALADLTATDAATLLASAGWRDGVPRDRGASWDFEDVRDFYLDLIHGGSAEDLRRDEPQRYLDLSRQVSGAVMAEVFGEWRRGGSRCGGGLVLWLADVVAGAGWGVLDSAGRPKPAYSALRRAFAPVSLWLTDEGLNGVDVHVANDRPTSLPARIEIALYRDDGVRVGDAVADVVVPAHGAWTAGVEALLGHFVDVSWAYRFGPPAQQVVVATMLEGGEPIARALRFSGATLPPPQPAGIVGLTASAEWDGPIVRVQLASRLLVHGVDVGAPGLVCEDSGIFVEPGGSRTVGLVQTGRREVAAHLRLTAVNLSDALTVPIVGAPT